MPMLCPICRSATFAPMALDENLPADECTACHGHWITSPRFFAFLNFSPNAPASMAAESSPAGPDSKNLKLCPICNKFMHYYRIGHDIPFGLDKCNTCGGFWLDHLEYRALKAQSLHHRLHLISSDAWQHQVVQQERSAAQTNALIKRLGPSDFHELQRILAWLKEHPQRPTLLAHLHEHLKSA